MKKKNSLYFFLIFFSSFFVSLHPPLHKTKPLPGPTSRPPGACSGPASSSASPKSPSRPPPKAKESSPCRSSGDVWLHALFFTLLAVSVGVAVWQLVAGADPLSPLLISVLWATYAAVPPALLLLYAMLGPGPRPRRGLQVLHAALDGGLDRGRGPAVGDQGFQAAAGGRGRHQLQTIGLVFRNFGKKVSQTLAPPPATGGEKKRERERAKKKNIILFILPPPPTSFFPLFSLLYSDQVT